MNVIAFPPHTYPSSNIIGGFPSRGASSGSFRGSAPGGRGGFSRGGGRGGFSSGGGRGGFSGGGGGGYDSGPPEYVVELGFFMHSCEGEMVCRCTNEKVPYFNAPVFLENKTLIGKVDEILGSITEVVRVFLIVPLECSCRNAFGRHHCEQMFTIKCGDGVVATSFKSNDKVYVGPDKLLPMSRFLNPP
jgi:H/ACA ribonucleoprotein complex subunit 1